MRKILIGVVALLCAASTFAGSTINPSVPSTNSPLTSAPLRSNFMAAYSDINNILGQYAGASAPPSPTRYQYWLDTTSNPATLKIFDGVSWVATAKLNSSAHTWSPVGSFIGSPVSTTYGGTGADLHAATGAVSMSAGVTSVGTLSGSYLPAPLNSLTAYNTNGLLTQTATNTFTGRTITGVSNEISVTNGDGVATNPSIGLPSTMTFTGKTVTGGTFSSPTLVTPALGTPASGVATNITGTASGLTAGNVTTNANLTGVITSVGNATAIASQTGTGTKFVVDTSPVLVTPTIGVATATSVNKVAITTPATSATLTIANGKTLTANNSLTLAGTDSTTMTFPTTSATIARTDTAQTFAGTQTFAAVSFTSVANGLGKVGQIVRASGSASGSVGYTGIGFKPSVLLFICAIDTVPESDWGFATASSAQNVYSDVSNNKVSTANAIHFVRLTDTQDATVSSMDSDGFTLAWTRTGTGATGNNINCNYLALR